MTNERPRAGVQLDDVAWQQRFQLSGRFARERLRTSLAVATA